MWQYLWMDFNQQEPETSSKNLSLDIINLIIAIIGIFGNLAVCIVIIKDKKFHKMTFYFMLNLAIADLLTCIVYVFSVFVVNRLENSEMASDTFGGQLYCKLIFKPNLLWIFFTQASAYSLFSLAIERYVSLTSLNRPGGHRELTKIQAGIVIAVAWLLAFGYMAFLTTYFIVKEGRCKIEGPEERTTKEISGGIINFLLTYFVSSFIMVVLYSRIVYILKKQVDEQIASGQTLRAAKKRITIILIIVTVAYIVLFSPAYIGNLVLFVTNIDIEYFTQQVLPYLLVFSNINSIINPFVYIIGYKGLRQAFVKLFCAPIYRAMGRGLPDTLADTTTVPTSITTFTTIR